MRVCMIKLFLGETVLFDFVNVRIRSEYLENSSMCLRELCKESYVKCSVENDVLGNCPGFCVSIFPKAIKLDFDIFIWLHSVAEFSTVITHLQCVVIQLQVIIVIHLIVHFPSKLQFENG